MTFSQAAFSIALLFGLGCQGPSAAETDAPPSAEETKGSRPEVWETKGVIKRIERDRGTITIHHEDVPGYMPAMTMPFWVESADQFEGLAEGDAVTFRFRRGEDGKHFIVSIKKR